ncbi:MAG: universal stress protein [Kiritimatiellae bacterium]|nr:universal stress protein [Kiritimatiellia bacterium]MCO5060876.1 universal stress protein [Kiritimatiellia bacterium]MCO5069413.1 universal stress protein [Kiritimatiellia bacterium]MCO6401736.1 universal stress protein [Verrucomicrobiota bacterium]
MIKTLMVFTDGSDGGTVACSYALFLAKRLNAKVTGCHILDSRMLDGPLMADISGWIGAQPFSGQLAQFRDLMQKKGEAVLAALVSMAAKEGVDIEPVLKMGHPARVILEEELRTEMIVLGQKGEHAELTGDFIGSTVERVTRSSQKPCLVTPSAFSPINKILCAYDGSAHAGKALREAVAFAGALQVPLIILSVAENHDLRTARRAAEDALQIARAHECVAANLVIEGRPDLLIPIKAEELDCGLIVVGAYGHSRIREMVLGSTTTSLIARTRKPVLLVR